MINKKAIDLEALTAFKKGLDSAYFNRIDDILDGTTPPQKVEGQYVSLENGEYNLTVGVTGAAPAQGSVISQINGNDLADSAFHEYINTVGAVIFSFDNNFSPSALWGGSWSRVTNRFLIGSGGTYSTGVTGGEANVTLTVDQMPNHNHTRQDLVYDQSYAESQLLSARTVYWTFGSQCNIAYDQQTMEHVAMFNGGSTGYAGNGASHNNMPPYIGCNIWRKIA